MTRKKEPPPSLKVAKSGQFKSPEDLREFVRATVAARKDSTQ